MSFFGFSVYFSLCFKKKSGPLFRVFQGKVWWCSGGVRFWFRVILEAEDKGVGLWWKQFAEAFVIFSNQVKKKKV